MLTKLMTETSRRTADVDLSILSDEIYDDIKTRLTAIAEKLKHEGIIDRYKIKPEIKRTASGGITMYKNNIRIAGVDVGWHNLSYGVTVYETSVGKLYGFEIERMLSDKITAILSRKRFRRPKDIYDLLVITDAFDVDLRKILEYMTNRSNESGVQIEWENFPFSETVLCEYKTAYDRLVVESVYLNRILSKPEFEIAYERFGEIVIRLKAGGNYTWSAQSRAFKEVS